MSEISLDCRLVVGKSKKSGNDYARVDIMVTPNYKKTVFLDFAEQALVKVTYGDEI